MTDEQANSILVVDDSKSIRKYLAYVLTQAGYTVFEASDGQMALDLMEEHPEIRVVFSDINMPFVTGIEMVERLAAQDRIRSLAIIMLTTEAHAKTMHRMAELGVKGWMVKPIDAQRLLDFAESLTHLMRTQNS